MDDAAFGAAARLVGGGYVRQGREALRRRERVVRTLLEHRRLPEEGWEEATLERFVAECSLLDANNWEGNCGAGEREARIACSAVRRRHFGLGHGIGRSGDVGAVQPKAAGSSLICRLAQDLVRDLLRVVGMTNASKGVLLVPLATGMSLSLVLLALRESEAKRRGVPAASLRHVVWSRIDQKTCLKAILTAGLSPAPVELVRDGDVVRCDVEAVRARITELGGAQGVLCVVSTTSCFAPRVPDDVEGLAALCHSTGVGHVINNAYGLQCSKVCHAVNLACRAGLRVDAVVQSTDKNLLVPVGGAIISGPDRDFVERAVSQVYPGRASMSPVLDVFLTLLSLGRRGYDELRRARIALAPRFEQLLRDLAAKHGERVLETGRKNTISFAITLARAECGAEGQALSNQALAERVTRLGSMLFTRGISGARVVYPGASKAVCDIVFPSYGASYSGYPVPYFTLACAIGISEHEVELLLRRVDQTLTDFYKDSAAPLLPPSAPVPGGCADVAAAAGAIGAASARVTAAANNGASAAGRMQATGTAGATGRSRAPTPGPGPGPGSDPALEPGPGPALAPTQQAPAPEAAAPARADARADKTSAGDYQDE